MSSAQRLRTHSDQSPMPVPLISSTCFEPDNTKTEEKHKSDFDLTSSQVTDPQPFNQSELNNLVRNLNLSKEYSEILASCLKEKNTRYKNYILLYLRKRFTALFFFGENLVYCSRYCTKWMGLQKYKPSDWCLFIDTSSLYKMFY